jgi:acylphosphatase
MVAENTSKDIKAAQVWILGQVQRIGFRFWTTDQASQRRLDGSIEAIFIGPPQDVDDTLRACRRGHSAALVNCVFESEVDEDIRSDLNGLRFSVRQTV